MTFPRFTSRDAVQCMNLRIRKPKHARPIPLMIHKKKNCAPSKQLIRLPIHVTTQQPMLLIKTEEPTPATPYTFTSIHKGTSNNTEYNYCGQDGVSRDASSKIKEKFLKFGDGGFRFYGWRGEDDVSKSFKDRCSGSHD